MVNIRRGDIYWVDLGPIVSSAPAKIRPFLIIQVDEITSSGIKTVIGCALTSNLDANRHRGAVELSKEDTGLPKDSIAKITEIAKITKEEAALSSSAQTFAYFARGNLRYHAPHIDRSRR